MQLDFFCFDIDINEVTFKWTLSESDQMFHIYWPFLFLLALQVFPCWSEAINMFFLGVQGYLSYSPRTEMGCRIWRIFIWWDFKQLTQLHLKGFDNKALKEKKRKKKKRWVKQSIQSHSWDKDTQDNVTHPRRDLKIKMRSESCRAPMQSPHLTSLHWQGKWGCGQEVLLSVIFW